MNSKIIDIKAREILDSRGNPTVEVELKTKRYIVKDSVPAGASKGKYEAKELRDGGKRYLGKGVNKAVNNVNKIIAPHLRGKSVFDQEKIDLLMMNLDGTSDKSRLGANAILGVSLAVCRAGAKEAGIPLWQYIARLYRNDKKPFIPQPLFNILNGGIHAGNDLSIQEFMIAPRSQFFSDKLRMASEIYHVLKSILKKKVGVSATNVGDEGGFAPPFHLSRQALEFEMQAIKLAGYEGKVNIVIDAAASQLFRNRIYKMDSKEMGSKKLLKYYENLVNKYPFIGIEDPFDEEDWSSFQEINKILGSKIRIIGDDLLVTNPERIKKAGNLKACNTLLLKLNQIGTVYEAMESAHLARFYNWKIVTSHRSGETCDDFISDFAVGIGSDFIKSGAPARGERVAKYNRLLAIEDEIKNIK